MWRRRSRRVRLCKQRFLSGHCSGRRPWSIASTLRCIFVIFLRVLGLSEFFGERLRFIGLSRSWRTDSPFCSNRSYLKLAKMTIKSITSGHLVEAKTKERHNNGLGTSLTDSVARRPNLLTPTTSQERPAPRRSSSEVDDTEPPSPDQVLDPPIAPTADPIAILVEQRKDIDRIMASVNVLRQDMVSLSRIFKHLGDRRDQVSHDFIRNDDILTDGITLGSSRLSELDALKLEMTIMQQRIQRMEESRSKGRRASTVLDSAQVSRPPSRTTEQQASSRTEAASNGSPFPATPTPASAYFEGLFASQETASERRNVVDRSDASLQGRPLGSKAEALPPLRSFTIKPKKPINGTANRGGPTAVNMPPPEVPRKCPEQEGIRRRSSTASNVATPRTAGTPITETTHPSILPRTTSQTHQASTSSHHDDPEDPKYDDELVHDVRPQSSSTEKLRQPASKSTPSRQNHTNQRTHRPLTHIKHRPNAPMPPPTPKPSSKDQPARARTAHHDSKRRKTTGFEANTPSASIWAADSREVRSSGGRRGKRGLLVRI